MSRDLNRHPSLILPAFIKGRKEKWPSIKCHLSLQLEWTWPSDEKLRRASLLPQSIFAKVQLRDVATEEREQFQLCHFVGWIFSSLSS